LYQYTSYHKPVRGFGSINNLIPIIMKKLLSKNSASVYYFDEKGNKHEGIHEKITGDASGIYGEVTGITGCVTNIYGCVSGISGCIDGITGCVNGISGCVDGITGYVNGLSGNIDLCEISLEERKEGIDINDLIN
jgi:phage-related protein